MPHPQDCEHPEHLAAIARLGEVRPVREDPSVGDLLRRCGLREQVHPFDAYAFAYPDRGLADAFADADLQHFGHPTLATFPVDGLGVVRLVDLRPALAGQGVGPRDPGEPDVPAPLPRGKSRR